MEDQATTLIRINSMYILAQNLKEVKPELSEKLLTVWRECYKEVGQDIANQIMSEDF